MKIMVSVCLKSGAFIPNPKPFPLTNLLCPSLAPWEEMEWWVDRYPYNLQSTHDLHPFHPFGTGVTKPKFGIYEYIKLLLVLAFSLK
jgi:hypothetical protein